MKNLVKKIAKNKNGITLMALVVTIIILLILAGISIGMLSGDSSIIKQAGNAKTQTDIAQEKEILEQATVVCMGKNKYGNIEETDLRKELENVAEVTTSGSKFKVTFPSERQYLIDQDGNVKEKKVNPNAMEISELYEGASTYFGWDVINYAETLPANLQDTEWQLFYAGALDGETEERIYLISKGYVKNTVLPEKDGATLVVEDIYSDYQARFSSGPSNGIIPRYSGSADIATGMQKYNKDYFKYYSSNNYNMKVVAYMLDTTTWSSFATSTQNYAEWAIGGPTVELLFIAYNKYKGLTGNSEYKAYAVSENGYQISKDGGTNYADYCTSMIANDTSTVDSPYSVSNLTSQARGYWLSSPCNLDPYNVAYVNYKGDISRYNSYGVWNYGFRPIVLLDSDYTIEKTKDSNGNDAFKIVEQ